MLIISRIMNSCNATVNNLYLVAKAANTTRINGGIAMKKDKILLSALLGGLSTIAGEIVTKILVALAIGQYAVFELNSLLVTNDRPSMLMGFIINFVLGSYVGMLFYLVSKKLGTEHLIIKAALCSSLVWFIFELGFTALIEDQYIPMRPVIDHYVHIIGTVTFGITTGVLLKLCIFRKRDDPA